tara:strand:- start:1242 stop:1364 length:123 start_codon:yes stop_codon:yes gene_type:complete
MKYKTATQNYASMIPAKQVELELGLDKHPAEKYSFINFYQ